MGNEIAKFSNEEFRDAKLDINLVNKCEESLIKPHEQIDSNTDQGSDQLFRLAKKFVKCFQQNNKIDNTLHSDVACQRALFTYYIESGRNYMLLFKFWVKNLSSPEHYSSSDVPTKIRVNDFLNRMSTQSILRQFIQLLDQYVITKYKGIYDPSSNTIETLKFEVTKKNELPNLLVGTKKLEYARFSYFRDLQDFEKQAERIIADPSIFGPTYHSVVVEFLQKYLEIAKSPAVQDSKNILHKSYAYVNSLFAQSEIDTSTTDEPLSREEEENARYRSLFSERLMFAYVDQHMRDFENKFEEGVSVLRFKFETSTERAVLMVDILMFYLYISDLFCMQPFKALKYEPLTIRAAATDRQSRLYQYRHIFPLVNYVGEFPYETWAYCYVNGVDLIGVPATFSSTYDAVVNCPAAFIAHDLAHTEIILENERSKITDREIAKNQLEIIYQNVQDRDLLEAMCFVLFVKYHETGYQRFLDSEIQRHYRTFVKYFPKDVSPQVVSTLDGLINTNILPRYKGNEKYYESISFFDGDSAWDSMNAIFLAWIQAQSSPKK